jgi:hypothetical protein
MAQIVEEPKAEEAKPEPSTIKLRVIRDEDEPDDGPVPVPLLQAGFHVPGTKRKVVSLPEAKAVFAGEGKEVCILEPEAPLDNARMFVGLRHWKGGVSFGVQISAVRSPGAELLVGFQGAIVGVLPQCFRDPGGLSGR